MNKSCLIGLLLSVSLCSHAQNWIQWPRSEGGNGHYFALTTNATNWDAAQQQAASWGGHLATITSAQEQNFVNGTFLVGIFDHRPLWIGLDDRGGHGAFIHKWRMIFGTPTNRFKWVTGEPLSYTFWKPGEPNNAGAGEFYVTINWEYSDSPPRGLKGDWNDTPLNGTRGYGGSTSGPYFGIVERDTNPGLPPRGKFATHDLLIGLGVLLVSSLVFLRRPRPIQFQIKQDSKNSENRSNPPPATVTDTPEKIVPSDDRPDSSWSRIGSGAMSLFVVFICGSALYIHYTDPDLTADLATRIGASVIAEFLLAMFIFGFFALILAVAKPKWAKRLHEKALGKALFALLLLILTCVVYSLFGLI